jgi:hypothetical protein
MCIIYWKIFQAARFRIRRRAFHTPTLSHQHDEHAVSTPNSGQQHRTETNKSPVVRRWQFSKGKHAVEQHPIEPDNPSSYSSSASHPHHPSQHDYELKTLPKSSLIRLNQPASIGHDSSRASVVCLANDLSIPIHMQTNPLGSSTSSLSGSARFHETQIVYTDNNNTSVVTSQPSHVKTRKKIDIKRERKATKVLGVVMGCFILCWLPFFIEETICGIFHLTINEKIISVLTWLGYMNSLLNPVIYTIFAPDFRQAFGKILFGRYRKRRRRLKK